LFRLQSGCFAPAANNRHVARNDFCFAPSAETSHLLMISVSVSHSHLLMIT
jgi:hypothetical protein